MASAGSTMVAAAPDAIPRGVNEELNKQLAEVWLDMGQQIKNLAGLSPGMKYDENLKPEQVQANLERIHNGRRKKSEKWAKLKKTFDHTLTAIATIGGLVAEAASQVFAPAGQCYNALNFIINAYKNYQSVFESLNEVFSQCLQYLGRLSRYAQGNQMTAGLTALSCDVLKFFAHVCGKALRIRSDLLFKLKTMAMGAFLNINEFTDMLDTMKQLTRKERLEVALATLETARETRDLAQANHNILEQGESDRVKEKRDKKDKRLLLDTLSFEVTDETWNSFEFAPIPTWGTTWQRIRNQCVDGTGKWALESGVFQDWMKENGDKPILGIVGPEASGKSCLASTIISHLRASAPNKGRDSRRLVAFYFPDSKNAKSSIYMVKAIIWQFAASDASYMQSAATTCGGMYIETKDLWTRLLLDNHEELKNVDATFYIVINKLGDKDGFVHEGVLGFLQELWKRKKRSVRVVFTAAQQTIEVLRKHDIHCPIISMQDNKKDLELYIDYRLNRMPYLSDKHDNQIMRIREEVQSKLQNQPQRNYYTISNILDQIADMDLDTHIFDVLNGPTKTLSQNVRADIEELNRSRTSPELEEINEVILWVNFAREKMTAEKMKAVLQFHNKAVSLIPLEDRLRKFLLFEIDDDGLVNFRSETILENIPVRTTMAKTRQDKNEIVNKSEIGIINHFLGNVCPPGLIDKLQLKRHFDKILEPQEEVFQEDKNTANFKLARACIFVLANEDGQNLRILRGYAGRQLVGHMANVNNLAIIDPELKRGVGGDLLKLFRTGYAIDNLLWAKKPHPELPSWIFDEKTISLICSWLKDVSFVDKLEDDWLKQVMYDGHVPIEIMVEGIFIRMAEYCFKIEESIENTLAALEIVSKLVSRSVENPNLEQIEDWCQKKLGVAKRSSMWHSQMALIYFLNGKKDQSASRCRHALHMDDKNWRASLVKAKLCDSNDKRRGILKDLYRRCEKDVEWMKEHKESLADMAEPVGDAYWEDRNFDKAVAWYSACVDHAPVRYTTVLSILEKYDKRARWRDIIELVRKMHSSSHLGPMFVYKARSEELHMAVLDAAVGEQDLDFLDQVYEAAIEYARKNQWYGASFYLREAYASARSARPSDSNANVLDLLEAAAADVVYTDEDPASAFFRIGYKLGAIYLRNATDARNTQDMPEAQMWLDKMTSIIPEQVKEHQLPLPLSLYAARYHCIDGNYAAAWSAAHNTLKMAMELLSDNDPTNDMFAFQKILYAMIPFEDTLNVITALAMIKIASPSGRFFIACSCKCGHVWLSPSDGDMWWCMDCINVVLTEECRQNVKDKNICRSTHRGFTIPKLDENLLKDVPKDHVPWDGEFIPMDKWRRKIAQDYRLKKIWLPS